MPIRAFLAGAVFSLMLAALAGAAIVFGPAVLASAPDASPVPVSRAPMVDYGAQRVVYHVSTRGSWRDRESEARRLIAVLNNHLQAVEPDPAEIQVILQGDGIDILRRASSNPRLARSVDALRQRGVKFRVCANTLEAYRVGLDTLHGVREADLVQAGVAELVHLQRQGFGYIKF
ncbi:MAG: DsrE family protein [Beijerinckiaceae bacterium]|nr:DsrE family protein [Beijerinckiaceae bacterium]